MSPLAPFWLRYDRLLSQVAGVRGNLTVGRLLASQTRTSTIRGGWHGDVAAFTFAFPARSLLIHFFAFFR